jgi:ribosomal-protein-alanine N-acetyltransferase
MAVSLSLLTHRLVLRSFEEVDLAAVRSYASDPRLPGHVDWGPRSEEEAGDFVRSAIASQSTNPRKCYDFAVLLRGEEALIGGCGLDVSADNDQEASIGCFIAYDYRSRGYAIEAAYRLLAFGFRELGLHRIVATCEAENVTSWRVLERIGMRREGYLVEESWQMGRWRDSLLYAILNQEWVRAKTGDVG